MSAYFNAIVVAGFLCSLSSRAFAQASFQGLGDLPGADFFSSAFGVSGDGTTVVGISYSTRGREAFRWTGNVMQALGFLADGNSFSVATGVSADGTIVVGNSDRRSGVSEAFQWTAHDGMRGLGFLPGATFSYATGISPVGSVIVGWCYRSAGGDEAFRFEHGMMTGLGDLPGGRIFSHARAASSGGALIVGDGEGVQGQPGVLWRDGAVIDANSLPGFDRFAYGWAVSPSGVFVVGRADNCFRGKCYTHASMIQPAGIALLDDRQSDILASEAFGVSRNGTIIVGFATPSFGQKYASLWSPNGNIRLLHDLLMQDFGVSTDGWELTDATAVSHDGLTIVGNGINPQGKQEGWVVRLNDADGVAPFIDNCPLFDNVDQNDSDGDSAGDACDACPDDPQKITPGACGCGRVETDSDVDGVPDCIDICPTIANPQQEPSDCNGDGLPDRCAINSGLSADCNGNNVPDSCDIDGGMSEDCDGNQMPDDCEPDSDGDGVIDSCDRCPGTYAGLVIDEYGCPIPFGGCCFHNTVCIDDASEGDCLLVGAFYLGDSVNCDGDADGDGFLACADHCPLDSSKVSPGVCGCGTPDADMDSDGTPDCVDACPNDPAKTEPGACGCGLPEIDTDADDVLDCVDPCPLDNPDDSDGDDVCDSADRCPFDNADDSDDDGVCNSDDGCPDDPAKSEPCTCGCGVADDDGDADGIADCIDLCPNTSANFLVNGCGCVALGACCFSVGVCFQTISIDTCAAIEGVYQGDGTACSEACGFGDFDEDGAVDLSDVAAFWSCFSVNETDSFDALCEPGDIDRCQGIDLLDYNAFRRAVTGP